MESDYDESIDPILQAQKLAFKYGLKPEEFNNLYYWELIVYVESVRERQKQSLELQQEMDLVQAYLTISYLSRAMSKRGLPSLSMELAKLRSGSSGELSPEASAEAVRGWLGKSAKAKK